MFNKLPIARQQQGVALISVLLIVAILLAVSSRLLSHHNLVVNQHQNTFEYNQALNYALGAETLARQALRMDAQETGQVDHLQEFWAQDILPFELDEGGFVEAQLTDLHGCLNLNNFKEPAQEGRTSAFGLLLRRLDLPGEIENLWVDWADENQEVNGFGAEDNEYLGAQPPHRTPAPGTTIQSLSELNLLRGMEREQLQRLLPFVCLLPVSGTKLNVNTAGAQVLASLDGGIDQGVVDQLVASERTFESVSAFTNAYEGFDVGLADELAVTSEYFQLHVEAQVGETAVNLQSVLYRPPGGDEVTVLRRDFGKLFVSNIAVDTEG